MQFNMQESLVFVLYFTLENGIIVRGRQKLINMRQK